MSLETSNSRNALAYRMLRDVSPKWVSLPAIRDAIGCTTDIQAHAAISYARRLLAEREDLEERIDTQHKTYSPDHNTRYRLVHERACYYCLQIPIKRD